jgi:hypothetical protein
VLSCCPQKLHAGLVELVRLVEDRHAHRGQQLGHARFAHGQVGKEQVVIDDHHVGSQGLAPRQVDVAARNLGQVEPRQLSRVDGDQRDHRRALVQPRQFGQVAGAGDPRPSLDLGQGAYSGAVWQRGVLPRKLHAVQAQVAAPALEQRHAHRQAQRLRPGGADRGRTSWSCRVLVAVDSRTRSPD